MKPEVAKPKVVVVDRVLDSRGVAFMARHRAALVALSWLVTRALSYFVLVPVQDIERYFRCAGSLLQGMRPYADFPLEYPPGSLLLFVLPRYFTNDLRVYNALFAIEMMALDLFILSMLWRLHTHIFGAKTPSDNLRRYDVGVAALAYIVFTFLLEPHTFQRYDLAVTALMMAWLTVTLEGRRLWLADLLIAMGIWIKLFPIILVPLYLGYLFLRNRPAADPLASVQKAGEFVESFARWFVKEGLIRVGAMAGFSVILWIGFVFAAGSKTFSFMEYHTQRGLQIESLYASVLLFLHNYFGLPLARVYQFGASEVVTGATPSANFPVHFLADASFIISAVILAVVSLWFIARMSRAETARDRAFILLDGTVALLLAFMLFAKVFSPQYLLWVAPMAALALLHDQEKTRGWLYGLFVVFFLTSILLGFYYGNLLALEPFPAALLLARNLLVLAILISYMQLPTPQFWLALQERVATAKSNVVSGAHPVLQKLSTYPWLPWAAFAFAAFWVFCANLSETTANDIFIQLRYGDDIINTHTLPSTEIYSATVGGRPFIAHEWLSGVLFSGTVMLFGNGSISILTAAIALLCFFLMHFAIPAENRKTAYHLVLLVAMTYLVSFRVLVRPHIFSLAAYAALALALERWRRNGQLRELLWLVPMQLIWVNLHGAALFGPAFMGLITGAVTVMVLLPGLQRGSETRRFGTQDIVQMATATGAMSLACLCNPYGLKLITFSLDLLNNSYAKERVWEWTTPFLAANLNYYWLWLFVAILASVWLSVLARIGTLPVIDLVVAVLMTYFSTRANRFVPDLAILGFPIVSRTVATIFKNGVRKEWHVQRPWMELGLLTLLFSNVALYGFAHSAREHRPMLGWGFGGDMPYEETQLIKKLGLKGVIFNEYSDGSLIIHDLFPEIRPVLDSRIDLFPLETVMDYDRAYMTPDYFPQYLEKYHVNIVLVYKNRIHPGNVRFLRNDLSWQQILDANNRLLFVKRPFLTTTALR